MNQLNDRAKLPRTSDFTVDLPWGDIDGDGDFDLVAANYDECFNDRCGDGLL